MNGAEQFGIYNTNGWVLVLGLIGATWGTSKRWMGSMLRNGLSAQQVSSKQRHGC